MSFHPTVIATGSFRNPTDDIVALLIAERELTQEEANAAVVRVRGQEPVPFTVVLGEVPITSAARELCEKLEIDPENATRRSANRDLVIAAASDEFLHEEMSRAACVDLVDLMARFARAGATISLVP